MLRGDAVDLVQNGVPPIDAVLAAYGGARETLPRDDRVSAELIFLKLRAMRALEVENAALREEAALEEARLAARGVTAEEVVHEASPKGVIAEAVYLDLAADREPATTKSAPADHGGDSSWFSPLCSCFGSHWHAHNAPVEVREVYAMA